MKEQIWVSLTDDMPRDHATAFGYIEFAGLSTGKYQHFPVYGERNRDEYSGQSDVLLNIEGAWCWLPQRGLVRWYPTDPAAILHMNDKELDALDATAPVQRRERVYPGPNRDSNPRGYNEALEWLQEAESRLAPFLLARSATRKEP